ncbi:MAG: hypothetical protein A2073_02110 [Deltaproteobacteria bacterium GWC2_42_11]|nr:MAG: hypothetical protein A2073_02110 [Deltaproteobacteria bacterium GWC2_42_11]HBO83692.1 penicillin-binding protein [Deltaproteobacteria bacterium]
MKESNIWLKFRIFTVLMLFFAAFMVVFVRAFQLQVVEREKLRTIASRQYFKEVTLVPKRGAIFDRNMKELAVSTDAVSVYAQPERIENPREVVNVLAPAIPMDRRELMEKINRNRQFVWIKRKVDFHAAERLKGLNLDGIGVLTENKRFYPNLQLASHVIGFAGIDSNGLEGVERRFDDYLKGNAYRIVDERDAHGEAIIKNNIDRDAAARGMDIVLTIDKVIQFITEKELNRAVASTRAKGGVAIVMDPRTGEVLAMAVSPVFNPNLFWEYSPRFWRNTGVADVFEPGSTFKSFLLSAVFEEGIAAPTDRFFCEDGVYRVGDRTIHDAHNKRYGWLTVTDIIRHSSNIGAVKIGEKLGKEKFYRYLKEFGFGSKTEIDMPGEASGNMPHVKKWSKVTLGTISFGQGVSVTGMQLVTAFSAIANKGYLMKPIVVKSVIDRDGKVAKEFNPEVRRRVISEETAVKVTEVLKEVIKEGGSGVKAAVDGFEVAGKTGTAQKPDLSAGGYSEGRYISSFIGFVPADNPRITILVLIDEPRGEFYGGQVAAPVFREIARQSLPYLGVYVNGRVVKASSLIPGIEYEADSAKIAPAVVSRGIKQGDEIVDDHSSGGNAYIMPDLAGKTVRQVLKISREIPLEVRVVGSGRAFHQDPMSGVRIIPGAVCEVWFR